MIYIKGINPTNNRTVYYRGVVHPKNTSWTEKLLQAVDLKTNVTAQNILSNLITMNMRITNYQIVVDNSINPNMIQQQNLVFKSAHRNNIPSNPTI